MLPTDGMRIWALALRNLQRLASKFAYIVDSCSSAIKVLRVKSFFGAESKEPLSLLNLNYWQFTRMTLAP